MEEEEKSQAIHWDSVDLVSMRVSHARQDKLEFIVSHEIITNATTQ
jgi:hypothetical protein